MGKPKREVWDFLMSIDYAVCHGPVCFNQVWIKDKRVLCGSFCSRTDEEVNLPKLFGGDDGEGGVVGTAEMYVGDATQTMSEALASRFGLTPLTAPGYRGLAHIFFRGRRENDGWRWTSNNPYLPPTRVSATREPQSTGLNAAERMIPATIGADANGNLVSVTETTFNEDLVGYGGNDSNGYQQDFLGYREDSLAAPEEIFDSLSDRYVYNLGDVGLARTVLIAADAQDKPYKVEVIVNLEQSGTSGAEARLHFKIVLDNGDKVDGSVPTTSIGDSYSVSAELEIPVNAVAIEAYFVYTRPSGSFVSRSTLLRISQDLGFIWNGQPADDPVRAFNPSMGPLGSQQLRDPKSVGFTKEAIRSGVVLFGSGFKGTVERTRLGSGPGDWRGSIRHRFIRLATQAEIDAGDAENGFMEVTSSGGNTVASESLTGGGQVSLTSTMPPDADFVEFLHYYNLTFPLRDQMLFAEPYAFFSGPNFETLDTCPPDKSGLDLLPDANPAHILYETTINRVWGLGENPAMIDVDSFAYASTVLYQEKFGLSLGWFAQDEIEAFQQEILDHIKGFLFVHPATGLWTLTLMRDDYVIDENTPHFDPSNCRAENRKRRSWGETVNEVVVAYTNPEDEEEATVSSHNVGNMQIQGGVISATRPYHGVRNPWLAKKLADRDVAEEGFPLYTATLKVNRSAWNLTPGSVATFSWPEDGIENMVIRILSVKYGSSKDRMITVQVTEDIFSVDVTSYTEPQEPIVPVPPVAEPIVPPDDPDDPNPQPPDPDDPTGGTGDDPDPTVNTADSMAFSVPLPILQQQGRSVVEVDAAPGSAGIMFLAYANTSPVLDVEAHTSVTLANGATSIEDVATFSPVLSTKIPSALTREATSTLPGSVIDALFEDDPVGGELIMVGRSERVSEILMLDSYSASTNTWTVERGIWDTVPLEWPVGSRVWPLPSGLSKMDRIERVDGEEITYRLLPKTEAGRLPYADAPDLTITATNRAHAPFRPANVSLDGTGFAGVNYPDDGTRPSVVTATWSTRNRQTEDSIIVPWGAASVTPETGQTVTLRITDLGGNTVEDITGLTGGTHDIPIASLTAVGAGFVQFLSVQDGEESWTGAALPFAVGGGGYGVNYGLNYGP